MSHAATKWAFDQPERFPDMKPGELVVLAVLADCHNPVHGCYPSQDYIATRTNLSERAVRDQLARLRERGLIDWDGARESGRRGSNRYRLGCEDGFLPANFAGSHDADQPANSAGRFEGDQPADFDRSTGKSAQFYRQNLPPHKEEPVKEPVKEPLREARASERTGDPSFEAEADEDPKAIDRAFWRIVKGWPGFDGMPKEAAKPNFHALTADERAEAERKLPGWLALLKAQRKSHVPAPSTYFREKLWQDVPEPEAGAQAAQKPAAAFGAAWGAARMASLLAGPTGPEPFLTMVERKLIEGGKFTRDALLAEKRVRSGWPDVNAMHERAEARAGVSVASRFAELSAAMEPVPVGSAVFEAWRALHAARGWPWIPDPGALPVVWFPAGGPEGLNAFEAAVRAEA